MLAILSAILLTEVSAIHPSIHLSTPNTAVPLASGSSDSAWSDVTAWLKKGGAVVSSKAAGNLTLHGGSSIRGVIATEAMDVGEILLSIPKKLWMHLDNFQVPYLYQLECNNAEFDDESLQAAVAVALEKKKGEISTWHAYLKDLPSLENYRSFYIKMASPELLQQFHGLPLASKVQAVQENLKKVKPCFDDWQQRHGHGALSWEDFQHGLAIWQTRVYGIQLENKTSALIPASDLLNTGRDDQLNSAWTEAKSNGEWHFRVTASKAVAAGGELYDSYCPGCTNAEFLTVWSVYLDDNDHIKEMDGTRKQAMKQTVLDTLRAQENGLTAPRCKKQVLTNDPQGPIKCAFARLAWEQYGKSWNLKSAPTHSVYMRFDGGLEPSRISSSGAPFLMNSRGMVEPQI